MRIAFLGNCQAQIMEQMVLANAPDVTVELLPPIWLIPKTAEAEILRKLDGCDFVFCQRVADDYEIEFLRTRVLKKRYGERAISWPNAYFDGYFPGIRYLYGSNGEKVLGPMDEYHFDFVITSYRERLEPKRCAAFIETDQIFERHPRPVHEAILRLSQREAELDITISDFLIAHLGGFRLFYSMNHPTDRVLSELLMRLLNAARIVHNLKVDTPSGYPLDKIVIPYFASIRTRYYLTDDLGQESFKGVGIQRGKNATLEVVNKSQTYSPMELVVAFYDYYKANKVFPVRT